MEKRLYGVLEDETDLDSLYAVCHDTKERDAVLRRLLDKGARPDVCEVFDDGNGMFRIGRALSWVLPERG